MSYQPLARKYRPATFDDLVGQEGVAKALANAIRLGREPHGVIFSGVRGIGKTTTARLYAKALNCDQGPTPDPCGICSSCKAIEIGTHEDVLEIDGASNTSVDDVRALRETVAYVPQRSKFKVYIIDEVHMLSQSAFNALLKTLEEPPSHVVFIFATTELGRIPQTIVSRCQTFYLQRFTPAVVVERLKKILDQEGIAYEDKALVLVAREGRGSMRDSLTFLDQAIALGGGRVAADALLELVGNITAVSLLPLLKAIVQRDASTVIDCIASLAQAGEEFVVVVEELAKLTRHGFVLKDLGAQALDIQILGLDQGELEQLALAVEEAGGFDLNRVFRQLVQCRQDLDGSVLDRFIFENYLLEWCFDPGLPDIDSLAAAVRQEIPQSPRVEAAPREKRSRSGRGNAGKLLEKIKANSAPEKASSPVNELVKRSKEPMSFPATWRELVEAWKTKKPIQARIVEEAHLVDYSQEQIHLEVPEASLAASRLLDPKTQKQLTEVFRKLFGFAGHVRVRKRICNQVGQTGATESLLEIKNREKMESRQAAMEKAKQAPLTQSIITAFDAEIEDIIVE